MLRLQVGLNMIKITVIGEQQTHTAINLVLENYKKMCVIEMKGINF